MSIHLQIIKAQHSTAKKVLEKILTQKNGFIKTINGLDEENRVNFLSQILKDNKLLVPYSAKLPLLYVTGEELQYLKAANDKTLEIYELIMTNLLKCHALTAYDYLYYGANRRLVFIFTRDRLLISKTIKAKLRK